MFANKNVVLYLAAVFAAGLLAGGAAGYSLGKRKAFTPPRTQDMAAHMCDRLKSKLNLTAEQETAIVPLVHQAATEIESLFAGACERTTDVFLKLNERQGKFLTQEQRTLLDQMERERQQFFHKAFKPKGSSNQSDQPVPVKTN